MSVRVCHRSISTGRGDALCVGAMSDAVGPDFSHLPPATGRLGAVFARPKRVAVGCIVALTALGWLYLAVLTAQTDGALAALCRPALTPAAGWSAGGLALIWSMWAAMVLAMMLPSAAPMILTYTEIAETAARKGEPIVSPIAIAAGFSLVWLGFASAAALAQLALKHACLRQCRQPFPFFCAHWETTMRGVVRLGVRQGLYCLGCCWAMMLVMFAVGAMNVVWMAGLAAVMTVEKLVSGNRLTYALGVALIAAGAAFVVAGFAAHWPLRAI